MNLYFIRHAETVFNFDDKMQGRLDSPLTEKGIKQTHILGKNLKNMIHHIDFWFESPLGRVKQTSAIIQQYITCPVIKTDPILVEINCGIYEGKQRHEIPDDLLYDIAHNPNTSYTGGESFIDVMERLKPFVQALPEKGDVFIIAHGNVNRALAGVLTGLGPSFGMKAIQSNSAFNHFQKEEGETTFRIKTWNQTFYE